MATVVELGGSEPPVDYARLTDVVLRRRLEAEHGLFLAEGEKVIRRALAAGYRPRSLLMTRRWLAPLASLLEPVDTVVYLADEAALERATGYRVHRGALAAFDRRQLPTVQDVVAPANRLLLTEAIVDHTNLGAIVRSAVAFGTDGMLLDPRSADPLYRRSIRVSMGTVFDLPWTRAASWASALGAVREHGLVLVALTPDPSATSLDDLADAVPDRLALMVGTEGGGLTAAALRAADLRVRIPMSGGVDSLNVAAAAAVACHGLRRRDLTR